MAGTRVSILCMSVFRKNCFSGFPQAGSKCKNPKSHFTIGNACVSFLKVTKKAELPQDYFVLTLGLPAPLESDRVAAKTEPYPGRWTTHFVISRPSDLDKDLFGWIEQAYHFAQSK